MEDTTSRGRTCYQRRGSNTRRGFGRSCSNSYNRGQGCGFNSTKPQVRGKCEALGSDIYSIGDPRQDYKYTKMTEAILNHIQGSSNKENYVKEALEELNIYHFGVIKPKIPVTITVKGSAEEIILR